jgi:hypothetical protein
VIALFLSIPRYTYVILLSRILFYLGPFVALEHALINIFCCYLCLTLKVERFVSIDGGNTNTWIHYNCKEGSEEAHFEKEDLLNLCPIEMASVISSVKSDSSLLFQGYRKSFWKLEPVRLFQSSWCSRPRTRFCDLNFVSFFL